MANKRISVVLASNDDKEISNVTLVSAKRTEDVTCMFTLRDAIIAGVTRWMDETEDGKKAYHRYTGAFNIGDLADDLHSNRELRACLFRAGVVDLVIDTGPNSSTEWTQDTTLHEYWDPDDFDDAA